MPVTDFGNPDAQRAVLGIDAVMPVFPVIGLMRAGLHAASAMAPTRGISICRSMRRRSTSKIASSLSPSAKTTNASFFPSGDQLPAELM